MFKQTIIKTDNLNCNLKDMLSEFLDKDAMNELDIGSKLSKTQKNAFDLFKENKSLLILGPGGCGKSYLLKTMQEFNNNEKIMYLCATTGISSYNINGMTIHSFLGIGTGEKDVDFLIKRVMRNKQTVKRLCYTDILVIDEISMLSAILFEKINIILQHIRKNKTFFGGIQVIFTGDLMQLTPVFNRNNKLHDEPEDTRLIIESIPFNKQFNKKNKNIIILNENFRQTDTTFMEMLLRIREGKQTDNDINLLKFKCTEFSKKQEQEKIQMLQPIHLVTSNKKAQIINDSNVIKISEPDVTFNASFNITGHDKDTCDVLKKELESQFKQKGIINLKLKKKCRVMLIKNLDTSIGLINGSIGTIEDFTKSGDPIVLFDNGIKKIVEKCKWEIEMKDNIVNGSQIPLILAYSLTCHKVQGLTLDNAVIDISDAFCDHQVYMALSRLRTLDGLFLKSFDPQKITVNVKMKNFLEQCCCK